MEEGPITYPDSYKREVEEGPIAYPDSYKRTANYKLEIGWSTLTATTKMRDAEMAAALGE